MRRTQLFAYQMFVGVMDACAGSLLMFAPATTMRLMGLQIAADAVPFLSWVGAFVFPIGVACLYGAYLTTRAVFLENMQVVWLLTGITRACVALFVAAKIGTGDLEAGWATVAVTDGAIAIFQGVGLAKGWLRNAGA